MSHTEYIVKVFIGRTEYYNKENQRHRSEADGPAIIYSNGDKEW